MVRLRATALTLSLSLTTASGLFAQGLTSLTGTVSDPTGAVVPGAELTLRNVETQGSRETMSDSSGNYTFSQVQSGLYQILAKAAGFTDVIVNDVRLLVNNPATVNITFEKVGAVAETISVAAEAVQVNTTDATLGNAFSTKPILQMPFEGRNVVGLLTLQPGVTYNGSISDYRSGSVNGGKSDQANVTLDGVDVNDQQGRSAFTSVLRVTLDSVQEFRVTTTNANADQGRSSGAQVALVTKSGTNEIHGSAYWFVRNRYFNANEFFNNKAGREPDGSAVLPVPKLNRNVYGASLGGSVIKNKLFFFGNYEGRQDRSEVSVLRTVPSAEMRQGTLRYFRTNGSIGTVTPQELRERGDPLGLGPSQAALQVMQQYPMPNDLTQGDTLNMVGFRFNAPTSLRFNTYITRWDYLIDSQGKHNLFFRGNLQNDNDTVSSNTWAPQFPGQSPNNTRLDNSKGLAVGYTSVLSPTLVNNFRYGFTRQGIENTGVFLQNFIAFRGLDNVQGTTRPFIRLTPLHNISNDMVWTKSKHTLSFGYVSRHISNNRIDYANSFLTGSTNSSWLVGSGSQLDAAVPDVAATFRTAWRDASMAVLGVVSQVNSRYNYLLDGSVQGIGTPKVRDFTGNEYELYVQDSFRMTRSLTLTAGLRWSLMPPIYESNGFQTNSIQPLNEWFNDRTAFANAGISQDVVRPVEYVLRDMEGGRSLYPFHKKNFAPRLSLAYSPQGGSGLSRFLFGGPGRTAIRAGWGMFYDLMGSGLITNYDASALGLSTDIANPSFVLGLPDAPRYQGFTAVPQQLVTSAPAGGFPQLQPDIFQITNSLDDSLRPPYTMNMNLTVSREFSGGWFVQGSYVGRFSRRSLLSEDLATPTNLVDPASGIDYFSAAKYLTYHERAGTPISQVRPNAFWENMYPGLATATRTATQTAYTFYEGLTPDYTYALYLLDVACPTATRTCSKLGPHAFYNRQYSYLRALRSVGFGNYNAMQWTLRKRFSRGDMFDLNYTLSKSIDDSSAPERDTFGVSINPWNRRQRRSVSDYDTLHSFNASGVVGLPFGRGRALGNSANSVLNAFIGGWQLSGLWRQTSGFPTSVGNGRFWPTNWNLTGFATQFGPVTTGTNKNAGLAGGGSGPNLFPNPITAIEAFDYTHPGESGDRTNLRGDGAFNIDLGLAKNFYLGSENRTLQFRWEIFNATNSVRFDPDNISLDLGAGRASFGQYQGTIGSARVMQFGIRIDF